MGNKPRAAREVLAEFLDDVIGGKASKAASVSAIWRDAAGEEISAHSKIIDISNGNLIVAADHPGWRQAILLKKKQIIKKISATFPEAKGIVFRSEAQAGFSTRASLPSENDAIAKSPARSLSPRSPEKESASSAAEKDDLSSRFERLRKIVEERDNHSGA